MSAKTKPVYDPDNYRDTLDAIDEIRNDASGPIERVKALNAAIAQSRAERLAATSRTDEGLTTPQQQAKLGSRYVPPHVDVKTKRRSGLVQTKWDGMEASGRISHEERQAGNRLENHIIGAVYKGHAYGSGRYLDDEESQTEFAITKHNQELARVRAKIGEANLIYIERYLNDAMTLEQIGGALFGYGSRSQAHASAMAMIRVCLRQCSEMWGMGR
jgi:hypothetical protein